MSSRAYFENFEDGPGGWLAWHGNQTGARRLAIENGVAVSRSPWWVDYNHSPPGGGYLHLLFVLHTATDSYPELAGVNRFVSGGYPTDFTNARITARLKGEVNLRGAQLLLWVQATYRGKIYNYALTGQPLQITPDWSEQSVVLTPEIGQWTCGGSRVDRLDDYGWGDIADTLRDVNADIIFVLFPLDAVPAEPLQGDPHRLRADEEYLVDRSRLPEGYVMMDEARIEFP